MTDAHPFEIQDGTIRARIDLRVYRLGAVKKTAYRLADRLTATLGSPNGDELLLSFLFKPSTSEAMAQESVRLFFQELLDQELREQVAEETAPIRTLILAQAFSKTDLIQRE